VSKYDLSDGDRAAGLEALMIARAQAIQAYANLEQSLCQLFAFLLGVDMAAAGLIFFRIVNTRARNKIIEGLLEMKYEAKYDKFWNSVFKLLRKTDERRNEIVHWHGMFDAYVQEGREGYILRSSLAPPNFWGGVSTRRIEPNDMHEFCDQCDFLIRCAGAFEVTMKDGRFSDVPSLIDIFQQPAPYPPPDSHPLSPTYKAPESPPPPSHA
jgi:hypothetical protein